MRGIQELLEAMIRIASVNPFSDPAAWAGEAELARFIADFWRSRGVDFELQEVLPGRRNVIAQIDGPGAPIILEAHMDTVPPDPSDPAPFEPRLVGGRIHGRGACDDKASLAAMMWAAARAASEGPRPRKIIVAATVDEEHQFTGARALAASAPPDAEVIVGEPTSLNVVAFHKGAVRWRLAVRGRAAHASVPEEGDNAIYKMARLVHAIEAYHGLLDARPKHPLLGGPTISVGVIRGGTMPNVVPDHCEILVDRRLMPGESFEEAEADLRSFLARRLGTGFAYSLEYVLRDPPLEQARNRSLAERLAQAAREVTGACQVTGARYGTNASKYAQAGLPAVVFGPGDPAQAHAADEWVDLWQVEAAAEILYRFITSHAE